jgi:WD40 repeat protein
MQHKRFSQILGTSVAMSLVVAMVIVGHSLIKAAIAVRGRPPVCLPASSSEARCFSAETTLVNEAITAIATSHHGTLLATASGPTIRLWDLSSGRPARVLQGHHNWITALVISPDGQTLASSSLDQTIQLWDL